MGFATHTTGKKLNWKRPIANQSWRDNSYERATDWEFGAFVSHSDFDRVSDLGKIGSGGRRER
ncbi:hypothetical protein ACRBEV_10630 [Methylobacterium phyllosphaerae]